MTDSEIKQALVFPFYDENNVLVSVKYRHTQPKKDSPKEWFEKDTKPILFGMAQCHGFDRLIITEGQIDSLAKFGYENAEPGDNSRYLRYALASWDLPPIDISDPKQVEQRIHDYFEFCIDNDRKPNMIGMANWLGVNRDTVNTWKNGEYRATTHSVVIKKAVAMLEELWVDYMQNGKINPASGIFLGKNMFGYKDTQDVVVTPNNPLGDYADQKQLSDRIEATVVDE